MLVLNKARKNRIPNANHPTLESLHHRALHSTGVYSGRDSTLSLDKKQVYQILTDLLTGGLHSKQRMMDPETGCVDDYKLVANLKQRFELKHYVHQNHLCLLMSNKISSYSCFEPRYCGKSTYSAYRRVDSLTVSLC